MQIKTISDEILSIFIPAQIKKKTGYATVILPAGAKKYQGIKKPINYNEKLVKAFTKAYKWKTMLKTGEVKSLSEVATIEKIDKAYIGKIFKLNYVAPNIVEAIINGEQPTNLNLRDFTHKTIPDLWSEQREVFGFVN